MTFEEYKNENYPNGCIVNILYGRGANIEMPLKHAFETSATENGIQWHDLRKDPNDLPKDCYDVLDEAGYKVFYHHKEGVWKNASGSKIVKVIAWCEIPQFKE